MFLKISQNLQENTCTRVSFLMKLQASGLQLYYKEALAQVFSCKFCEISKNTFFTEHLPMTATVYATCWRNPLLTSIPILYSLRIPGIQRFSVVYRKYKMKTLARNRLDKSTLVFINFTKCTSFKTTFFVSII